MAHEANLERRAIGLAPGFVRIIRAVPHRFYLRRLDGLLSDGSVVRNQVRQTAPTIEIPTSVRRHRCRVIGASQGRSADLHRFDYPRLTILVLGEERQGLSPAQRGLCTDLVRIPMVGTADSLNLAVAGSLLLYEVYRARTAGWGGPP
jgi:tRNA G18 (ribose-2'-O)-methylase SpoU